MAATASIVTIGAPVKGRPLPPVRLRANFSPSTLAGDRSALVPSTFGEPLVEVEDDPDALAEPEAESEGEPVAEPVADAELLADVDVELVGKTDKEPVGSTVAEPVGNTDVESVGDADELAGDDDAEPVGVADVELLLDDDDAEPVGDADVESVGDTDAVPVGDAEVALVLGLGDVTGAEHRCDSCMSLLPAEETVASAALFCGVPASASRVSSLGVHTTAPLPDCTTTPCEVSVVVTVMIPAEAKWAVKELMPVLPAPEKCHPTPECDCWTSA